MTEIGKSAGETTGAYKGAKEALEGRGFLVFTVKPQSLDQLLTEKESYFGYVIPSKNLRRIVPPSMVVAINPNQVALHESNNKPIDRQLAMTRNYSRRLQKETGLKDIEAILTHASVYAQLDIAYQEQRKGKLFPDFYACTIDKTIGSNVANVGRGYVGDPLNVAWLRVGGDQVYAVPVVVLPSRK